MDYGEREFRLRFFGYLDTRAIRGLMVCPSLRLFAARGRGTLQTLFLSQLRLHIEFFGKMSKLPLVKVFSSYGFQWALSSWDLHMSQ